MKSNIIVSNRYVLGGTPVFKGTRVPPQVLIEYLEAGDTIDDFLDGFPSVKRKQVLEFLDQIKEKYLAHANPRFN